MKVLKTIINIIRYIATCFFLLGFFIFISKQITMAITYLLLAISLTPIIYELIFKKSKISGKVQVTIQIIIPIVVFFVMSAIVGFTS